jgi:AhpD family alkylhydroperoxidase
MPILKLVEENDASPEVREIYDQVKANYGGFLPDLYKLFGNDPDYLRSIVAHMGTVMEPRQIDAKTKEVIAFVVSAVNGCDFCTNAHAGGLRQHGVDDAGLAEILATVGLWEEITRFAIGARLHWPTG